MNNDNPMGYDELGELYEAFQKAIEHVWNTKFPETPPETVITFLSIITALKINEKFEADAKTADERRELIQKLVINPVVDVLEELADDTLMAQFLEADAKAKAKTKVLRFPFRGRRTDET